MPVQAKEQLSSIRLLQNLSQPRLDVVADLVSLDPENRSDATSLAILLLVFSL